METTKKRIIAAINTVLTLNDYNENDCIFSQKYNISPVAMIYALKYLSADFKFIITDEFVDSLEMCTFGELEKLLELYGGNAISTPDFK